MSSSVFITATAALPHCVILGRIKMFGWHKALFTASVLSYCHCLNCFGRVAIIAAPPVRRSGCACFFFFFFSCGNATSLSRWKCFVIVLLVNAFPTASFYLSIHLFISFPPCPLCNMGSHFHISNGNTWCSQRKELENSLQCILHSFSLTTPLFTGFYRCRSTCGPFSARASA